MVFRRLRSVHLKISSERIWRSEVSTHSISSLTVTICFSLPPSQLPRSLTFPCSLPLPHPPLCAPPPPLPRSTLTLSHLSVHGSTRFFPVARRAQSAFPQGPAAARWSSRIASPRRCKRRRPGASSLPRRSRSTARARLDACGQERLYPFSVCGRERCGGGDGRGWLESIHQQQQLDRKG